MRTWKTQHAYVLKQAVHYYISIKYAKRGSRYNNICPLQMRIKDTVTTLTVWVFKLPASQSHLKHVTFPSPRCVRFTAGFFHLEVGASMSPSCPLTVCRDRNVVFARPHHTRVIRPQHTRGTQVPPPSHIQHLAS